MRSPVIEDDSKKLVYDTGLISPLQLLLSLTLIAVSVSILHTQTETLHPSIRSLTFYLNSRIFGKNGINIYSTGENIDDFITEFTFFDQMQEHFVSLVDTLQHFEQDSFADFTLSNRNHTVVMIHLDGLVQEEEMSLSMIQEFFVNNPTQLRQTLADLTTLRIILDFGGNERVKSLQYITNYRIHSKTLMRSVSQVAFQAAEGDQRNIRSTILRYIQRGLFFVLLVTFLIDLWKNNHRKQSKTVQTSKDTYDRKWRLILSVLCVFGLFSSILAPLCAFLLTVPLFERRQGSYITIDDNNGSQIKETVELDTIKKHHRPETSSDAPQNSFNFNQNLWYSCPIVLALIVPLLLVLHGFIFYSMVFHPSEYFDVYIVSAFSYVQLDFQYGTLQILLESIKRGGYWNLFLTVLMYFYLVLVANNLMTAVFCTLAMRKIVKEDLNHFIKMKLESAICPMCKSECFMQQTRMIELTVDSPQLSPYIRPGSIARESVATNNYSSQDEDGQQVKKVKLILGEDGKLSQMELAITLQTKLNIMAEKLNQEITCTQPLENQNWTNESQNQCKDKLEKMMISYLL